MKNVELVAENRRCVDGGGVMGGRSTHRVTS